MKKIIFFFLLINGLHSINAQYTDIINSKRPGLSESPYGVGTNVYQFESGFFYRSSDNPSFLENPNSYGSNLFFRLGKFREKLEINANIVYQIDEVKNPYGDNFHKNGLSDLTIGAKYLVYQQEFTDKSKEIRSMKRRMAFDWKRLIPSVGVYAGVHTNFIGKEYKSDEGISYKGALLLQNDISNRLVLITNFYADNYSSDAKYYGHIVTATFAMNELWSVFIENDGKYKDGESPSFQFGSGLAYLFSNDLQIDLSARTNFFDAYSYYAFSAGFSWRLDKHRDSYTITNSPTKNINTNKRKGFFARLFGKKNRKKRL